jgi:hypothetical protein
MTEAPDTIGRRVKWKRYLRWGLATAGMACWTSATGVASYIILVFLGLCAGGAIEPEVRQFHEDAIKCILVGGPALALAPWIISGIVFGIRWWRSRATPQTQATE